MLNVRNSYWVVLLVTALLCWGSGAVAQTGVHGYTIPTADGPRAPSIAVCGSTANPIEDGRQGRLADRRMTGLDSRRYTASVCLPVGGDTGPRAFSVPIEVAEAIEIVEHSLVAHFEHDSATFDDVEVLPAMDVIVSWMIVTPEAGLKLQGHTDSTGDADYNMELSHQRVEAVKSLFVKRGVVAERIRTEWFGENNLLLAVLGRQRDNRRVDIEVYQIVEGKVLDEFVPPVPVDASTVIGVVDTPVSTKSE
jgi:outer membrane protein OmpA-like peptidoglycan-associated protein